MTVEFKFDISYRYWECSILAKAEKDEARRKLIWSHWNEPELAGIPEIQCGYYRIRRGLKGARVYRPVAIISDPDIGHRVMIGGQWEPDPKAFWERHAVFIEPISYEDYVYADTYGRWPGDIPGSALVVDHNADDPGALFRDEMILLTMEAEEFLAKEVDGQEMNQVLADKLANWRERIGKASATAAEMLDDEVRPSRDIVNARRALWKPRIDDAEVIADRIKAALTPFLAAQAAAGLDTKVGGQGGRKMSLRQVWYGVITDWDAAIESLKEHPKLRVVVQEIADSNARSKELRQEELPGIAYTTRDAAV
jgi:hypothetical protein